MVSIYDVNPNELIDKASDELKKVNDVKPPEWAIFVKTGMHKERPPSNEDWWYTRSASILRTIYKLGPIGVSKLRTKYGGRKRRGYKPEHFYRGSGNIARKVLQQLEKAGLVKLADKSVHKGRIITGKGKSFLDKIATQIAKGSKSEKAVKVVPKEEKKERKKERKHEEKREEVKKTPKESPKKERKSEEKPKEEKKPELKEEIKNTVEEKKAEVK